MKQEHVGSVIQWRTDRWTDEWKDEEGKWSLFVKSASASDSKSKKTKNKEANEQQKISPP